MTPNDPRWPLTQHLFGWHVQLCKGIIMTNSPMKCIKERWYSDHLFNHKVNDP